MTLSKFFGSQVTVCEFTDQPLYLSFLYFPYLQVTRVDDEGSVSIRWVDGTVSKVKPQELYKFDTEVMSVVQGTL